MGSHAPEPTVRITHQASHAPVPAASMVGDRLGPAATIRDVAGGDAEAIGDEICLWSDDDVCEGDGTAESPDDGLDFAGATLVDVVNAQRHLVLREGGTGECLCSRNVPFSSDPGEVLRFSATFPAPPEDVTTMTVEVPNFPAVPEVPVS